MYSVKSRAFCPCCCLWPPTIQSGILYGYFAMDRELPILNGECPMNNIKSAVYKKNRLNFILALLGSIGNAGVAEGVAFLLREFVDISISGFHGCSLPYAQNVCSAFACNGA